MRLAGQRLARRKGLKNQARSLNLTQRIDRLGKGPQRVKRKGMGGAKGPLLTRLKVMILLESS